MDKTETKPEKFKLQTSQHLQPNVYYYIIDRVNFHKIRTPKAFCDYLYYTTFLEVLRGAESKSAGYEAQKCPKMPQN